MRNTVVFAFLSDIARVITARNNCLNLFAIPFTHCITFSFLLITEPDRHPRHAEPGLLRDAVEPQCHQAASRSAWVLSRSRGKDYFVSMCVVFASFHETFSPLVVSLLINLVSFWCMSVLSVCIFFECFSDPSWRKSFVLGDVCSHFVLCRNFFDLALTDWKISDFLSWFRALLTELLSIDHGRFFEGVFTVSHYVIP